MRWRSVLLVSLVLALMVLPAFGAKPGQKTLKTEVSYPVAVASSPAFRDLPVDNTKVAVGNSPGRTIPNPQLNKPADPQAPEAFGVDAVRQYRHGNAPAPSPLINFEGINNISGYAPPDTEGDIGPNHYMQWVNVSLAAWSIDRSTWTPTLAFGPVLGNSIWSALGGQCASDNWGDPIVVWDRFRNRWVISQFALGSGAGGPYKTAIAVSKTDDPTGQWWLYCFDYHATTMNDYPKFGVWPDGYYYTCNQFTGGGSAWGGAGVMVFEADKMITGDPTARQLKVDLGAINLNYGGMLPAHFEGTINPPASSPGYFLEVDDSSWIPPTDALRLWKATVDWTAGTFSVGLAGEPDLVIPTSNWDILCSGNRNCIPQPGTADRLDAIGDRLMYRLQYRNFGSYEAMVVNHTVNAGSAVAGVRWYELRKDSTAPDWYLYQEGTYAPADGIHRWMGSVAQDHMGDLALGYSMSDGTATYPSVGYVGRLAGDPIGTLPQSEVIMHLGVASQTTVNRWGDYSSMSIDPVDDCTFWYTQEYSTGGWDWATRIGAFKFGSCSIGPTGTLSGTVTDSGTAAPIAGATVSATNGTITVNATTGGTGTYSMTLPVTPPTYDVTASAFGYTPATVNGVAINNGATTTQDFALGGATSYTVSGTVTDMNTGWGLYANVTITASGWAGTTIQTNPTTGAYAINLVGGATYNFSVASIVPGYTTGAATLGPLGGPAVQDFALAVNNCTAPGYSLVGGISESFTGTTMPAGWSVVNNGGTCTWVFNNPGGRGNLTGGTGNFAVADADDCGSGTTMNTELRTPILDFTGVASVPMSFQSDYNNLSSLESADVDVSVNGAAGPWTNVWHQNTDQRGPMTVNLDLSAIAGNQANVMVRFHYIAPGWDWWWEVDDLVIGTPSCVTPPGGLIVGFVRDATTTNPITAASVVNATTAFTGFSNAQGFYAVYAAPGANSLTASKPTYQDGTATPTGIYGATVQQDFNLVTSSSYTLSGTVTDATTGWPLYASLAFTAAGYPNVNTWTDPVTGAYSVVIFGGTVYTVAGTAWAPGYTPISTPVGPIAGDTTQDFTMAADVMACTAPGYSAAGLGQNWDSVTPPAMPSGWTSVVVNNPSGTVPVWVTRAGSRYPSGRPPHSAPNLVFFNSYSVSSGKSARLTWGSPVDITALSPASISFWMYHDTGYTSSNDRVQVQVSTDGGTVWQNVGSPVSRYLAASNYWSQHTVSLTGITGPLTAARIGILGISAFGNDCHLDDITIGTPGCSPPAAGGLVVGNVYDANTALALNGATVNDTTSGRMATTAATPDPNIDDGFYCLYGADGANTMAATAPQYGVDNQTPSVPHYGAVRQDFHLPVGRLAATPTSLAISLLTNQTGSQTFDLTNIGGGSLNFTLTEAAGHPAAPQWDLYAAKDAKPQGWAKGQILAANKKKPVKILESSKDRIVLSLGDSGKTGDSLDEKSVESIAQLASPAPKDAWPPSGPVQLFLDDNGAEDSIGLNSSTAGFQFLWFNRFTPNPTDFPFVLDQISVVLGSGAAPAGGALQLVVWEDTDGGDPSNATLLGTFNVTVVASDNATWNNYTLSSPVACNGPGDVLVGVINRYTVSGVDLPAYPASIDQTASQGRSWVGGYLADPADPPVLPADNLWGTIDSFGLPGNWLIRASGGPGDVPWLDENPKTGLLAPAATQTITVDYDSTGLAPGVYLATIMCGQDTPYGPVPVPVTLTVLPPVIATAATADPVSGMAPLTVNFTGLASGGDGGPYTYDWNFGDGSPHSILQNPAHTYNIGGAFTVTLTATDATSHTGTDTHLVITVTAPAAPVVLNFYDDTGRARLCLNRITGAYSWEILSGPGVGVYTGVATVVNGGAKAYSKPGDPNYLNCTYDALRKRAAGYFYTPAPARNYSRLTDSNTTNNPPGCF